MTLSIFLRPSLVLALGAAVSVAACDSSEPEVVSPVDFPGRDAGIGPFDSGGDPSLGAIHVVSPKPRSVHQGTAPIDIVLEPEPGTIITSTPTAFIGGTSLLLAPGTAPNQWIGTIEAFDLPRTSSGRGEEQLLRVSAQDSAGGTLATTVRFSFDD